MELKSKYSLQKKSNIKKCGQMRVILGIGSKNIHNFDTFLLNNLSLLFITLAVNLGQTLVLLSLK